MTKTMQFKVDIPWTDVFPTVAARALIKQGGGVIRTHTLLDEVLDELPADAHAAFVVGRMHDKVLRTLSFETMREEREVLSTNFCCKPFTGKQSDGKEES